MIAAGPRSPQPGAPYTFVTTKGFLSQFGLDTLRDLPDLEKLEEAGLLAKDELAAGSFQYEVQISDDCDDPNGESAAADSPYRI